jgi:threonine synthase
MGLELAEQLGWDLPDAILYPTGGGTGLIGMWKAFGELAELGWLSSERRPRMFACQAEGCAPLLEAFRRGERFAKAPANPSTQASGLRVPKPLGDFLILDAVRASRGEVRAAREEKLLGWMHLAASTEGIPLCPESAACLDVLETLVREGRIDPDERVVVFNTAAAQKYVELIEVSLPRIASTNEVDWGRMRAARAYTEA